MKNNELENIINNAWENRDEISINTKGEIREAVEESLEGLDEGQFRVAEPTGNHQWIVNQWLKKAVYVGNQNFWRAKCNKYPRNM